MIPPTPAQIAAAVQAFLTHVRRHYLRGDELTNPRWVADPISSALRAAEAVRPQIIQDRDEVARDAGHLGFHIEAWSLDGKYLEETIAATINVMVAHAAFVEAIKRRPESRIQLRKGIHLMEDYVPPPKAAMGR